MGSRFKAYFYLISLKIFKDYEALGRIGANSFRFRHSDYSSLREILVQKEYDFLSQDVKSGKIQNFLDCGGHIGLPGLWFLQHNKDLEIFSIEANKKIMIY